MKEKVADSKIPGYVWTWPEFSYPYSCSPKVVILEIWIVPKPPFVIMAPDK